MGGRLSGETTREFLDRMENWGVNSFGNQADKIRELRRAGAPASWLAAIRRGAGL